MNPLTPQQKKRVVTEFSALEQKLDLVLFARNDDDEDDGFPYVKAAIGGAAVGGAGYGGYQLFKHGADINAANAGPVGASAVEPGGIAALGAVGEAANKPGFLKNLGTGAKSFAAAAAEKTGANVGVQNLREWLANKLVKGAAKAV